MLADYHVHTEFSDDSACLLEQVVQGAIALGLDEICISDCVDYGAKVGWDSGEEVRSRHGEPLANVDYPHRVEGLERMRRLYGWKIGALPCGG